MKKPLCIFCVMVALALMAAMLRAAEASPAAKPNIVFILTDDQAPWGVGVSGNEQIKTPNLDKLFRQGAYLRNAFTTTPVCSPSRATLMTSRYGVELGILDWIQPGRQNQLGLDPKIVIWPEILKQNGYATGLVGKWHLGVPERFHPTKNGFDYYMGFLEGGTSPKDPTLEKDGEKQKFTGLTTDILTDHALEFIDKHAKQTPFLLCVHYRAPHAPYLPVAPEDLEPYQELDVKPPHPDYPHLDTKAVKNATRGYMASISGVDRNVGRLMAKLDELKLTDNTIVIFTSDHGYNIGHNGVWHKGNGHWILTQVPPATKNVPRGQRPNMYDNSLRVPMTIRWPKVIKPGTEITQTISFLDIYPTLCAMANSKLPEGELIRGRDFTPILRGEAPPDWNNDLFAQYSLRHYARADMRVYRTPQWKLKRDFLNPELDELYHLTNDPEEGTNLIHSDRPEVKKAIGDLHAKLLEKMKECNDPVLLNIEKPTNN